MPKTSVYLTDDDVARLAATGLKASEVFRRGLDHAADATREDKLERVLDTTDRLLTMLGEHGYRIVAPGQPVPPGYVPWHLADVPTGDFPEPPAAGEPG